MIPNSEQVKAIAGKIYKRLERYFQQPIGEHAKEILTHNISSELTEALSQQPTEKDLQLQISDWQDETFPNATVRSTFAHLVREILELEMVLGGSVEQASEELADCQHLLFGIASKLGINLMDATAKKFEVNKKRKWGQPDENGVVEHIKEDK